MKKYKLNKELYTFKNNPVEDIDFGSIKVRQLFNYDNLNVELLRFDKSDSIGYFYDVNEEENGKETIDLFYILEGAIKFIKKNKILQKKDYFTISNYSTDTEYIVLENLDLLHIFIEEEESVEETLDGFNLLNESENKCHEKDEYTHGHNSRVSTLSESISRILGLTYNEITAILLAARYHDIGKVEIEDEVLFKQGKLTEEEFEHIKNHTLYGYEMTKDYPDKNIPLMIKQHHERLDGTGYPEGIRGDELLFGSQVISVADIYDALATERPYKKAFTPEKALKIIYENADKHYKKEIVDALKELLITKGLINKNTDENKEVK